MRATKLSSDMLLRLRPHAGRSHGVRWAVDPPHVHFGTVPTGSTIMRQVALANLTRITGRFQVAVPSAGPLKVEYKAGPVASGLQVRRVHAAFRNMMPFPMLAGQRWPHDGWQQHLV